ncbi:golgin subfamily B member 1 [Rhynchocyon petersi]
MVASPQAVLSTQGGRLGVQWRQSYKQGVPGLPGNDLLVAPIGCYRSVTFRLGREWLSPLRAGLLVGVSFGIPELTWLRLGTGGPEPLAAAASSPLTTAQPREPQGLPKQLRAGPSLVPLLSLQSRIQLYTRHPSPPRPSTGRSKACWPAPKDFGDSPQGLGTQITFSPIVKTNLRATRKGAEFGLEIPQEMDMDYDNRPQQSDVPERLACAEKLVEQLKDIIKQKDSELQQKDVTLQEERKATDNKIKKMRLHAKAKLTALNKQLEEMKAQTALPTEPQQEGQLSRFNENSTQMEEFARMKQQLKEKDELINTLQAQLSQTQEEQAAQLSSMQQVVREKDARFETQVRLHEDELLQLVTQADVETQMQQNLRVLQRKLEEHEEALSGRAQVVDLLQEELNSAEQHSQILIQQLQGIEAERNTLKNTLETERQESKILIEKLELEVAEKKLSFHNLQEEIHHLSKQLEQAGQAQAELESRYTTLEQKHKEEMEEKTSRILSLQKTEQELQSSFDSLKEQNSKLLQEKSEQLLQSAQAIQHLEDQLHEKSKEISQFLTKPTLQKHEIASQTSFPDVYNEGIQAVAEETITSPQKRVLDLENEKETLLPSSMELEELQADNETLPSQITLMKAQNKTRKTDEEFGQISTVDNTCLNKSASSTDESGQGCPDDNIFSKKHKELTVLLLEMKEAQEEIAFLKSQLKGKRAEGQPENFGLKEVVKTESEEMPPVGMKILLEDTGQDISLMPNEKSSLPTPEKEEQTSPSHCHQDEVERLKSKILELELNLKKAEEMYESNLDEKTKEVNKLTQLIEDLKKNAENTSSAFTALSEERDHLLLQVKELSVIAELKAQVQQLEANLAEVEKQRRLDYESQTAHQNLFTEQIYSLSIEAKSKDVKMELLQSELDSMQVQFSEQSTMIKSLQSQLQKKETEVLEGEERLRDLSIKMEELSHALSHKELEITKLDQLLLEKKIIVETLQQTIKEKDQQVTEISFSMTEKVVQLNEEKFSLGVEIKTLKEQLNLLSKAEEAKKEHVEKDNEVVSGLQHHSDDLSPSGLMSREELQHEFDLLKKESEQRKRKLQAALINRKELLQRVSRLEEELARVRDASTKEIALHVNDKRERDEDEENKAGPEKCVNAKCQEIEICLKQTISEKDLELQHLRKDLEEKMSSEGQLQATIKQINENLQDKTHLIDVLQAQIIEKQEVIETLTTGYKDAGDGDSASFVKEAVVITPAEMGVGEQHKTELEDKMLVLQKEKEQIEKKLQEVAASRKAILKKAQEIEKNLREELKQQKDAYNNLQAQIDEQAHKKENTETQLRQLQIQIREPLDTKPQLGMDQEESSSFTQGIEDPLFKTTERQLAQPVSELFLAPDLTSHHEDANVLETSTSIDQVQAQLKEIESEKEELELKVNSTISELTKKSDEVVQLQEQLNKQVSEIQSLKKATSEAEARTESLRLTLESSQLEIAKLEHLRGLQPALDELQKLIVKKEEEVSYLSEQLSEKENIFAKVKAEIIEQEDLIKALHTQLEMQAKEHDEKIQQLQGEISEMTQKLEEREKECRTKQEMQRKLQAALISRKEALKENKDLQEQLALATGSIERLNKTLADVESQVSAQNKEKDMFLEKLAHLQEERNKLIAEVDRSLLENKNLNGSCESLKLALEGLTEDKENLVKEIESLKCSHVTENTEWQEKHKELQKEYEVLLQSYENVSNETERIQHVVEAVRQEKQELYGKLKSAEANNKETEKQLQEAEQEIKEMKGKMRKFAKSKQQKIIELEEENDRLRAENLTLVDTGKESVKGLISSNSNMTEELERVTIDYKTLSTEHEALVTEYNILTKEVQNLKHQLEENVAKQTNLETTEKDNQMGIIEDGIQSMSDEVKNPESDNMSFRSNTSPVILSLNSAEMDPGISENNITHGGIPDYLQQIDQLRERIVELEKEICKKQGFSQALENERDSLVNEILSKDDELKILQEEVTRINLLNQHTQEELSRVTKLKETAEEEKDELEERLMNQLAELNGSIGNYYQDVTDAQIKNEQLESEMQNLKKCVNELEEEKRKLVKEKTERESELRKEYMEKLQDAQKGPGIKSHTKELQELLKEKQQEVQQLQKDCIRYQEKISALEKTIKALEFVQSESQKDLEVSKENLSQADERHKKTQAELASLRVLLDDTQSEAARVLADNLKLKKELQSNKELVKRQMKQKDDDLERRLEQAEENHQKEKMSMQEKLDALCEEKAQLEETFGETQLALMKKDTEVKQLQGNLHSTMAQLAAFTKSMSSLQDDRDRVMDEAKKWETKFSDAIQTKENELRLKEESCCLLKDQLRQMTIHMEELKINISRLEHDKQTWESKAQTEVQLQQKVCETLKGENKELGTQLEKTLCLYHNSQNELAKLESELKILRDQLADLRNSLEKCQESKENLEELVKQQKTDIQNLRFSYEQLETDLQVSRDLTNRQQEEMNIKEQKIISLISAKEEAVQVATSQLQQQHDKEIKELENQLSQKEEENKNAIDRSSQLMEALNTLKKESMQQKTQLDSFVKSMSSLQDDRDHIVGDYQQLEERHLSVILEKDQLIQDAATENNKLKEEMRCLRSHMDDLNSENAKLDAELIQYREDLNKVISIKDCQQKQLLEAHLQQNKELKEKYVKLEEKLKECEEAKEALQRSSLALQEEKQSLSKETESLKMFVAQLKEQVKALQEDALGLFQAQFKLKEEEVEKLSVALSSSQNRIKEVEEELVHVKKEASKQVGEMEDKLKKELKYLHHDAGIMRNETETAEERVAELARDLMEMEQKLLMVTKEKKDLTAQIQSFGRSMSSLQNSRDQANEELNELKRKYDSSLRELAQLKDKQGLLMGGKEVLVSSGAFPKSSSEDSSSSHHEEFNQQFQSKDEQLLHLSSQLEDSYNQVQSVSKAMVSLQSEKDHLLNELARFHKLEEEKKQWSAAQEPATSSAEVESLKKAMSSLQNDRDRLLKELKNLQQQYLQSNQEITELRPLKAQLLEYQEKTKAFQIMQEQCRQENLSWQHELHQLRAEKSSWETHERMMKEQYLIALSDKDQQLSHLQNFVRELRASSSQTQNQRQASPETSTFLDESQNLVYEMELLKTKLKDSLQEIHLKELRFQQLNSKFSQLLEEKNNLSVQLSDTTQSLRQNQKHCSDLINHCTVLEKQVKELQVVPGSVAVAPGALQEDNGICQKSDPEELKEQLSVSEVHQQLCKTKQEASELKKLLEEERDQRATVETALSSAKEQIRRLEQGEWDSVRVDSCGSQEHALLIDLTTNSCQRTRSGVGWKRVLRSLCHSRNRVPLLAAIYLLMVHVLLILCLTGHF